MGPGLNGGVIRRGKTEDKEPGSSSWSQKRHHGAHFVKVRVQEGSTGLEVLESTPPAPNSEGTPALAQERVKRGLGGWKQSPRGSRPARAQAQRGLWGSSGQLLHFQPWRTRSCSSKTWLDLPLEFGLKQVRGSVPAS